MLLDLSSMRGNGEEIGLPRIVVDQVEHANSDGFAGLRRGIEDDSVNRRVHFIGRPETFAARLAGANDSGRVRIAWILGIGQFDRIQGNETGALPVDSHLLTDRTADGL